MSKSGFSLNDKKSKFSLIDEQTLANTSSKPIMTEKVSKSWTELSSLNEVRLIVLLKETNNVDKINKIFMNNNWTKIGIFVKLIWKVSMRWKNGSTILELTATIQELQNEETCVNDSRDFRDAESVRSGQSHVASQPVFSHFFQILAEC